MPLSLHSPWLKTSLAGALLLSALWLLKPAASVRTAEKGVVEISFMSPEGPIKDALVEACPIRLRPVLMTSVATVAAAFPLIIGNSIGQETRTPMGLTIIGGTIVSTFFTLFVVPCVYLLLSHFELKRNKNKFAKNTGSLPPSEPSKIDLINFKKG